jgi:hypothetical protein
MGDEFIKFENRTTICNSDEKALKEGEMLILERK